MQILHWSILILLVTVMPFLLGMVPVKVMNSFQKTPAMAYLCGWFVSFSVFELVSVPFILLERSFTEVVIVYSIVIAVILVISAFWGKDMVKQFLSWTRWKKELLDMPLWTRIGWIVLILMIGAQMFAAVYYEYYDGDDAYYIAQSVMADTFDTMYVRDNYTGYLYDLDIRHALSPTPIYIAWMSRISGIHSAMIAHSVLAPVWLFLMYCVYSQIGKRLLAKNKDWQPLFLIFLSVWFFFGKVSLYTAETFVMTRTWQGKGLMAGVILPTLLLCLIYLADKRPQKGSWILLVMVVLSSAFATSVSFMLVPTVVGIAAVLIGWQKRSAKTVLLMGACCIPCIVLALCYLLIR